MKKFVWFALVMAVALPALTTETSPYDFTVTVLPSRSNRFLVRVQVNGPEGIFTIGSEMAPDEEQTVTSERGGRTLTFVLRLNTDGGGTADLEVKEKGAVVAASKRLFNSVNPPDNGKYLRVGGSVEAPVIITRVEPVYPAEARARGISGIVIVEARVSEEGIVDDVRVLKPLPYGLDQAAIDGVKQWRFRPGMKDGKAIPVIFNITVNFRPEKSE